MPLSFSAEEMDLLLSLAAPIDQRQRTQFLTEVTTAIEEEAARTSVSPGLVHRVARTVQRRFFDPAALPNSPRRALGLNLSPAWGEVHTSRPARPLLGLAAVPSPP
jgi:hypothetical protein